MTTTTTTTTPKPPILLFGYTTSTFTLKARLALNLKKIPYTFIPVPTMMPRPSLRNTFNLTYRKIPILAIGRDLYCDTSLILEALEHFFPESEGYQSLYPLAADGRNYRPMIRGFASYWTDRPLFRIMCGLMPASIWASAFGRDREGLIGHPIDAVKLGKKIPENLAKLDMQLSMLEPLFENDGFVFSTDRPSLADLSLYYELKWGEDIAAGKYTEGITEGETTDGELEGAASVLNAERYPGLYRWYKMVGLYFDSLESMEEAYENFDAVVRKMKDSPALGPKSLLLPTPRSTHAELDKKCGLEEGVLVSVAPDDTGRDDPTLGTLVAMSPEEVVIKPQKLDPPATVDVRIHFPRLGFVVRPVPSAKL